MFVSGRRLVWLLRRCWHFARTFSHSIIGHSQGNILKAKTQVLNVVKKEWELQDIEIKKLPSFQTASIFENILVSGSLGNCALCTLSKTTHKEGRISAIRGKWKKKPTKLQDTLIDNKLKFCYFCFSCWRIIIYWSESFKSYTQQQESLEICLQKTVQELKKEN